MNSSILHEHILYEKICDTPVYEAYQKFCKVFECETMDYREYDYLYYHLNNDNVQSGIKFDQKTRQLSDVPIDLVKKIIGNLDYEKMTILRNTSTGIRDLVDNFDLKTGSIALDIFDTGTIAQSEVFYIDYSDENGIVYQFPTSAKNRKSRKEEASHLEVAMREVELLFNNPNNQVDYIQLKLVRDEEIRNSNWNLLETSFKKMKNSRICTVSFAGFLNKEIATMMQSFTPGILSDLYANIVDSQLSYIMKTDHWKQLKIVKVKAPYHLSVPIDNIIHLTHFDIPVEKLTTTGAMKIHDAIVNSSTLRMGMIRAAIPNPSEIAGIFGQTSVHSGASDVGSNLAIDFDVGIDMDFLAEDNEEDEDNSDESNDNAIYKASLHTNEDEFIVVVCQKYLKIKKLRNKMPISFY